MRAARSGSESIRICSSSAWAPAPRGPRPSRVGIPKRRGEIAVAAAAGRALGQLQAERLGSAELPGLLKEGGVGRRSLHRRPVERAAERQTILGIDGSSERQGRLDPFFFGQSGDPHVDLGRRVGGHDVGRRAALDDADVDGRPGREVLRVLEIRGSGARARRSRCGRPGAPRRHGPPCPRRRAGTGPRPSARS